MKKRYYVNPGNCTGCKNCELACATAHSSDNKIARSRINIEKVENNEIPYFPIVCLQCEKAACKDACQEGAINWNTETGALEVDYKKCTKCMSCVSACPFGNMFLDSSFDKVIKCDLCNGNPACVSFCPTKTIVYCEIE